MMDGYTERYTLDELNHMMTRQQMTYLDPERHWWQSVTIENTGEPVNVGDLINQLRELLLKKQADES